MQPGEVLPPVRELASQLAVNRNTVAAAYKRLVTSGLAVSQGRNGTAIKRGTHCRRWREVTQRPR
ncbi:transcriptional regulator of pyridoxine metabolism [Klebsiella pneumoniae subsp. ozaenae]|uniref:Transcriptional regulator of pyridoxine metabolism n=1 Tax=Klebsiella pneumoniae subsp. ozaenae TaxID=574 RepID=A0A378A3A2_KLEPO|nr:transcriptional regulator of pyridoxine metabolism [Klebsiella pneumoniae subsp. ozaenae]